MIRSILGRLLGYERKISALEKQIEDLSWDSVFGMWTRVAFLQFCAVMPRGARTVVFVDFDDIHGLNKALGYAEVDRRIRRTFSIPLRSSDIVGRWYSGDEIVILFDSDEPLALDKLNELRASAERNGMSFACSMGRWEVGKQDIKDIVEDLSERTHKDTSESGRSR